MRRLTDSRDMVIPILVTCLPARAALSVLCRTPVYKVLAQRLVLSFERTQPNQQSQ
jgi:hypothetical protein